MNWFLGVCDAGVYWLCGRIWSLSMPLPNLHQNILLPYLHQHVLLPYLYQHVLLPYLHRHVLLPYLYQHVLLPYLHRHVPQVQTVLQDLAAGDGEQGWEMASDDGKIRVFRKPSDDGLLAVKTGTLTGAPTGT